MLKGFKLHKKETKKTITVSDISGPTSSMNEIQLKGMNTVPIRTSSNSTTRHYPLKDLSSSGQYNTQQTNGPESALENTADVAPNNLPSLYAIVLYDFEAEKSDELTCRTGENLFVCAHHEYEWFIAKPIGRLGGPGLVPISFVSIIDINTGYATGNDIKYDINSIGLPTVQEWKKSIVKYKASNINLGSAEWEFAEQQHLQQQQELQYAQKQQEALHSESQQQINKPPQTGSEQSLTSHSEPSTNTDKEFIIDAAIESYTLEDEKYWFHLTCVTSKGFIKSLKRSYEDFYDLQVKILENFPREAGKILDKNGKFTERIVPYIPGPVPYVSETITKQRKDDLNLYVKELTNLPIKISRCSLVLQIFQVNEGNKFDKEFLDSNNTVSINNIKSLNKSSSSIKLNANRSDSKKSRKNNNLSREASQTSSSSSKLQNMPAKSANSSRSSLHHPYHQQLHLSTQTSPYKSVELSTSTPSFTGTSVKNQEMQTDVSNPNLAGNNNEDSTLTTSDIHNFQKMNLANNATGTLPGHSSSNAVEVKSQKIKFYYKDDIFALLLKSDITLDEMIDKITSRVDSDNFGLFLDVSLSNKIVSDEQVASIIKNKQKIYIEDE